MRTRPSGKTARISISPPIALMTPRNVLIYGRRRSRVKAAGGKLDNSFNLLAVQPLKPFHDAVDVGSGFQIFKDAGDRHPGTADPGTAYLSWNAFDRGALGPIQRRHE